MSDPAVLAAIAELRIDLMGRIDRMQARFDQIGATKSDVQAVAASTTADLAAELRATEQRLRARTGSVAEELGAAMTAQRNAITLRLGTLMVALTAIVLIALLYLRLHG